MQDTKQGLRLRIVEARRELQIVQAQVAELEAELAETSSSTEPNAADDETAVELRQSKIALHNYAQRLEILREIDLGIIKTRSIPELVDNTLNHIRQLIACQGAGVGIIDYESNEWIVFAMNIKGASFGQPGTRAPLQNGWFDAFAGGKTHLINDLRRLPNPPPFYIQLIKEGMVTFMRTLIMLQGRPIGLLTLMADIVGFFTLEHQEIAVQVADQLAVAIHQLRLSEALAIEAAQQQRHIAELKQAEFTRHRYAQRLEILREIDAGIIEARSIQALVDSVLRRIRRLIPCQRVSLLLIDETTQELVIFADDMNRPSTLTKGLRAALPPDWFVGFDAANIRLIDDLRLVPEPLPPGYAQLIHDGLICGLQALCVVQGRRIGMLGLNANIPGYFNDEYREIAAQCAGQLAVAIHQLRLSEELARRAVEQAAQLTALQQAETGLQRYAQRLEMLRAIDIGIIEARSLEELVGAGLQYVRRLIPCQCVSVGVIDWTSREWVVLAADMEFASSLGVGVRVPVLAGWIEQFGTEKIVIIDDLRALEVPRPIQIRLMQEGIQSSLQVMLIDEGRPIGSIYLIADTPAFFSAEHREIIEVVADQLSVAIRQARLTEDLMQHTIQLESYLAEIKRAEAAQRESETRYQQILESAQEGVWMTDAKANTTFINTSMASMLGYTAEEISSRSPTEFMDDAIHPDLAGILERRRQGISSQYDIQFKRKDGSKVWVLINSTPLFDAEKQYTGTVGMIADITDRKRYELEMDRKNRDLETLLYITSHDLREPLRAIRNFSQMVGERYSAQLDAKGQDFLARIIRAGDRMDRLIEDVLQLSRAQRKVAPAERISSETLIAEALKPLEAQIAASTAKITLISPLPDLFVDRFWARQALFNLLANALKFTRPNFAPEIEISVYQPAAESADGVGLVVRDRGIGLSPEYVERIFGLFQRAVGREIEGTGAGLAIVREVAERHGGRAWAQPRADGGAEFFITFGVAAPP